MKETFKDILDYEGLYQISNLGNIKSLERTVMRLNGTKHYIQKEHILRPGLSSNGYNTVALCKESKGKTYMVSRLVSITFLGYKPNVRTVVVDHKNNIKTDDRLENLQIITQRKNTSKDQFRHKKTSQYVGVYWDKHANKWRAKIWINDKNLYLGCFTSELDAANAYQNRLKQITVI